MARSWPRRDLVPSQRRLAAAFAAVGFVLVENPSRSFWRLSERDVRANVREFQATCRALGLAELLEPNGELDEATIATLLYLHFLLQPEGFAFASEAERN